MENMLYRHNLDKSWLQITTLMGGIPSFPDHDVMVVSSTTAVELGGTNIKYQIINDHGGVPNIVDYIIPSP